VLESLGGQGRPGAHPFLDPAVLTGPIVLQAGAPEEGEVEKQEQDDDDEDGDEERGRHGYVMLPAVCPCVLYVMCEMS